MKFPLGTKITGRQFVEMHGESMEQIQARRSAAAIDQKSERERILAEYRAAGVTPLLTDPIVSLSLMLGLGWVIREHADGTKTLASANS